MCCTGVDHGLLHPQANKETSRKTLTGVAQEGYSCPIPGIVKGQAGQGLEHPGIEEGVPAHGKGWNKISLKAPPNPNHSVVVCEGISTEGRDFPALSQTDIIGGVPCALESR